MTSQRGAVVKGDKLRCPECGRYVGYRPDKFDYHVGHLLPHRVSEDGLYGRAVGEWCHGREYVG